MKKIHAVYGSVIVFLLLVIAALAYKFLIAGDILRTEDRRVVVRLEPAERAFVLEEMRGLLGAVQAITEAVVRDDARGVVAAARPVGMAAAQGVPGSLAGKLPLDFKRFGRSVHEDFDRIALDAEAMGDTKHSLAQLGETIKKCVACHAEYQLGTAAAPGAR